MNQHIDTIPVWDAYKTDCECPLCVLAKKNEEEYVDNFLGASVMEPDRRVEVNEKGFCRRHFEMMFDASSTKATGWNWARRPRRASSPAWARRTPTFPPARTRFSS